MAGVRQYSVTVIRPIRLHVSGVIQNGSRLHKRKGIRMHLTKPAEETKLLTR
ncbi:MAG TPA: hypothetical protein VHR84_01040 [Terriglobales bacterium]|nr:hypothetical protein [Terriglobales bacterium]